MSRILDGYFSVANVVVDNAIESIDRWILRKPSSNVSHQDGMKLAQNQAIVAWWWLSGIDPGNRLAYDDICETVGVSSVEAFDRLRSTRPLWTTHAKRLAHLDRMARELHDRMESHRIEVEKTSAANLKRGFKI